MAKGKAIQFLAEDGSILGGPLNRMAVMAAEDPSPVVRLYLAYFDRAPGPAGLGYWQHRLDMGTSTLSQVSASFAASRWKFQSTSPSSVTQPSLQA